VIEFGVEFGKYVNLISELDKVRKEKETHYPWACVSFNGSNVQVDLFWDDTDIEVYGGYPFTDTEEITFHPLEKAEDALHRAIRRARG